MAYQTLPKRLEDWASNKVPGLRAYLKRQGLREADKIVRDELVNRMDRVKDALDKAKRLRVDAGGLVGLDKLDRATRKIEKVRDTIKFDSRGYKGLFDPQEVAETELMHLLDFDQNLFTVVEALDQAAAGVAKLSDADLPAALLSFEDQVEAMANTLTERENYANQKLPAGVKKE